MSSLEEAGRRILLAHLVLRSSEITKNLMYVKTGHGQGFNGLALARACVISCT
jgi:hypothetical protein